MTPLATVQNLDPSQSETARVELCDTFLLRLRGLMFRHDLEPEGGILLTGERDSRIDSAIHMLFVHFDLAVFWINSDFEIVDKVLARSWHAAYVPRRPARHVLELHPRRYDLFAIGDKVKIGNA